MRQRLSEILEGVLFIAFYAFIFMPLLLIGLLVERLVFTRFGWSMGSNVSVEARFLGGNSQYAEVKASSDGQSIIRSMGGTDQAITLNGALLEVKKQVWMATVDDDLPPEIQVAILWKGRQHVFTIPSKKASAEAKE